MTNEQNQNKDRQSEVKSKPFMEGQVSKGGQNPPNHSGIRPAAPKGSQSCQPSPSSDAKKKKLD